jgi:sugar lactone lactonase YvrE
MTILRRARQSRRPGRARRGALGIAASLAVPAVTVGIGIIIATLHASSPKFFQSSTQADFLKGDIENLSIDNRGQLVLGPSTQLVYETPSPFLWALAPGPNGTLFVGTGNEGKVFRVETQGALGRGSSFFDAGELEVHALAPAPDGGLYAASSPDGRIYKVDRNGRATPFFDPDDKYIWALASDAKGNLYAGTGDKGVVYKISPDGKGAPFYRTKATHATALAFDRTGNLLVGTESPGRLLRVDSEGRGFLLLDTPFGEIRALRFDDKGMLYVAAVSGRGGSGGAPPVPVDTPVRSSGDAARPGVPTVTVEVSSVSVADTSGGGSSPASGDRGTARGAIYRVAPDGLWDELWESRDDLPYDVILDNDGRLIVATGNKGKIYRLDGDPLRPTLLARASAQQVTALYKDARGAIYYATANPGKLYRLTAEFAPQGSYVSEVQDAKTVATWGTMSWRGTVGPASAGAKIEVSTRSGNSETPDDMWSPWSAAYPSSGSAITSPKARYLQWRAVLSGRGQGQQGSQGPILTSATAAYLQNNLRPQVRSITVHPPGIVFQKPFPSGDPDLAGFDKQTTPDRKLSADASGSQGSPGSPALGRRAYEKGLQTLIWKADDENGDELVYDLDYRREGESTWKPLRHAVTDPIYVWDTTTVPNGTYFVRVRASDLPSNGRETALTGELDSSSFDIDNSPPRFSTPTVRVEAGRTIVTFDVSDDQSPIQRVESSRDGQEWSAVFPKDGIADSKLEHYEVSLEGPIGLRGLSLRATDAMNNVATTQVEAPAQR